MPFYLRLFMSISVMLGLAGCTPGGDTATLN